MAFILPELGNIAVDDLNPIVLRQWLTKLSETPPRVRSNPNGPQQHLIQPKDANYIRKRQNSANRVFAVLKAALNRAFDRGLVEDDSSWVRVRSFRDVSRRKIRFLEKNEIINLIEACPPDLARLVCGGVLTGCRIGELERMIVNDYLNEKCRLAVTDSKSKELRYISLSREGIIFFKNLSKDRDSSSHMFLRKNGTAWRRGGIGAPSR